MFFLVITELPFWCHRSSLMHLWYPAPKEKTASGITYQELKSSNFHSPFTTWFTQISQRNQATEGQHHAFAELWTKTFYDVMLLQKPTSRFLQWWTLKKTSRHICCISPNGNVGEGYTNGLCLGFTPWKLVWFCFGACQWLGEKDSKQLNIGWWMLGYPLWCSVYTLHR